MFNKVLTLDFVRLASLFSSPKQNLLHSLVPSKIKILIPNYAVFPLGL